MIQHYPKWRILLLLSASYLIHLAPTQCCVYEFITHPSKNLSCNPLGSRLQLHCAVSGPSSPAFTLHWYKGNRDGHDADVVLDSLPDYSVMSGGMEVKIKNGGEERRTISSVLQTVPILDSHRDQCFWCEVEVEEMEVSLYNYNHKFCLDLSKELSISSPCEDVVMIANIQLSCIALEDVRLVRRALSENGKSNFFSTSISPTSTPNSDLMVSTTPSVLPSSDMVHIWDTSSTLPLPNTSSVNVANSPSSTVTGAAPQTTSAKGGLIAAITICVVFIIAIIVLVGIAIFLYRNRCSFCKMKKEEESVQRAESRNSSMVHFQEAKLVPKQTVPEDDADYDDADYDSLVITIADAGGEVTAVTSSPHLRRHTSAPAFPQQSWKKDPNSPRESPHFNVKCPPPPPPPPSAIYNHLIGFEVDQNQYQKCHDGEKPQRSLPTEHIYHTLECSSQEVGYDQVHGNDSEKCPGSTGVSPVDSQDYSEVMDLRKIENASPSSMAQEIRKLFDDPRYAMMVVEGMQEEEGWKEGLNGRREMWHSTPSLGSTGLTGRTEGERRSLRMPHSIVVGRGRHIYS